MSVPPPKPTIAAWLAPRLREAREDAGLTQAELAAQMGHTQTAVSYWESGERLPRLDDRPRRQSEPY